MALEAHDHTAPADMAVSAQGLRFAWPDDGDRLTLDIEAFGVGHGERVFLRGPSGSGKSTLLGLICGVLAPGSGALCVAGEDMSALSASRRDALRAREMGVIFQLFNLAPYLSVVDNVILPCLFSPQRAARASAERPVREEAVRLLHRLGLGDGVLAKTNVSALSVGQQQRVAAARALIGRPRLVVADEPTSALDVDARDAFVSLLIEECQAHGASLIFVSHDRALAGHFDRTVDLAAINRADQTGDGA